LGIPDQILAQFNTNDFHTTLRSLMPHEGAAVSLPDLTHSSVKQLPAASLRCDCSIRSPAFMSGTWRVQKPNTFIESSTSV